MTQVDRNLDYDFLRFIGMACIILAHVGVKGVIFQIRNFDVPLMVIISGISFVKFSSQNYSSYLKYIQSRFLRLVVPTWIFLVIYDSIKYIYSGDLPSFNGVCRQLTLTGGVDIGIWIIRIFFTMALISPFVFRLNSTIRNNKLFFLYAIVSWVCYEFAVINAKELLSNSTYVLLKKFFFFTYSYGVILMYGMRLADLSKKSLRSHIVLFATLFSAYILYNYHVDSTIISTQAFKHPPRLYYVSYAILTSLLVIYITIHTKVFNPLKTLPVIRFIGKSTMWIYLWHWLCLRVYGAIGPELPVFVKYIIVFSSATIMAYLQSKIIKQLPNYIVFNPSQMSRLNKIFVG